eukprot:780493_1
MTLNPLNNNILAVGCRDKWIRLYDRRTLTVGNGKNAKPYMLLTQHSLLHKQNGSSYADSEGVTGLAWSYDGQELAASYSAKNIALFNLYAEKSCLHFNNCLDITKQHEKSQQQANNLLNRFTNMDSSDSDNDNDDNKQDIQNDNDDNKSMERSISPSPNNDIDDDMKISEEHGIDEQVASFINDEDSDHDNVMENNNNNNNNEIESKTVVQELHENHSNNRVKKAVSKVKGLMTDIKAKAKTKNNNFKRKIGT